MYRGLSAIVVVVGVAACSGPRRTTLPFAPAATAAVATTDAEELRAFAKLYGYVRFFHPSDEAAAADWDAVAIEGARRVVQGRTQADLLAALRETFGPLAPTLLVYREDQPPPVAPALAGGAVMAWQHEGLGMGEPVLYYRSGRTGRPLDRPADGRAWAPVSLEVPANVMRGKRVRLRGWARVDGADPQGKAQLWLRVDGEEPGSEFFDNMSARPITSTKWESATIETPPVGADARWVAFGGIAVGSGAALFDDFALEVAYPAAKAWTPIPIPNPGFEAGEHVDGWITAGSGRTYSVVDEGRRGGAALKIHGRADLFEERPALGETFERPLGAGLACRVVLGLPATTMRATASPQPTRPSSGAEDPALRAAAVIIAWNVLRHFYPYHDVIGEDWNAVLDDAIADVLDDAGPDDLYLTLRRLVHRLHDGHAHVRGKTRRPPVLPIRLALVDGVYVVLAADPGSGIHHGDELVSIDGVPMADLRARGLGAVSGSPQWSDHLLLAWGYISEGPDGSIATIELRRGAATRTVTATRRVGDTPVEFDRAAFEHLPGRVLYIDLDRATDEELRARMPEIARAPGVIFDLRGYPRAGPSWLGHLLRSPDRAKWNFVPHIIRPDYERVTAFTEYGYSLMPAEPRISGKVAFITGPGAMSYAESIMGIVAGYRLGAIVGAPTAGANGNVKLFDVPGGFRVRFTGMRITRLDGRQHHLIGVQPTHPVTRTLAGIRAGRDEELEAALDLVRPD